LTLPLHTLSQTQLQNSTVRTKTEDLRNCKCMWFHTQQYFGCVYRLLRYTSFLGYAFKDSCRHGYEHTPLLSHVSAGRTPNDHSNIFFKWNLFFQTCSEVDIWLICNELKEQETNLQICCDIFL